MKKFKEVLEEIKTTSEALKATEANEKKLIDSYLCIKGITSRIEKKRTIEADLVANSENIKNLKITIKILKSNAKIALYNEVMPVALDVIEKYKNKPYGEKTRQKISDEIKEKTGCRFYIHSTSYGSDSFDIYTDGNDYNISCGTVYNNGSKKPLLIDNKIQPVTFDEIALYYVSREYVEDIPQRVEELKTVYMEAAAKQKELMDICDRYNELAVGDLHRIYHYNLICEKMDI